MCTSGAVAQTANAEEGQLEDIVVTARKQNESLQRVPISISAIGASELVSRSLNNLGAIGQTTPNFTFSQQAQGGRSAGVAYIRGVGQSDTLATYDAAVGVYIDGIYLGRMQGNDLDMMDIERVEVLRGPQGTLFGKNTSGGAISIVTRQPDPSANSPSGRLQVTTGNFERLDFSASINAPLVSDKVAVQVAAARRKAEGFGRRVDGQQTGSTDRWVSRAALLVKPTERMTATFVLDGTTYDEANSVSKLVLTDPTAAPLAALNAFTSERYDDRWIPTDDYFSFGTGPNSSRGDLWGVSLTLDNETGWGNIKSITSYRNGNVHNDLDPDNSPVSVIDQFQHVRQHQFSQEVQIAGRALSDKLDWVFGVYYFHEVAHDYTSFIVLPPLLGFSGSFNQNLDITNDSMAAYGQGTYKVTDKLRLTLGARVTHDKKTVNRAKTTYVGGLEIDPTTEKSASWDDFSPRLGIDYQWTPEIMTYASVAKGYKGGGFNGRANSVANFTKFAPEQVWTYEVGLRSDLFNRTVRFNATAFYSDYKDIQLPLDGSTIVNGAPTPFNLVINAPKSRISGGEVELKVVPAAGLTLSGGLGLTYGKYTRCRMILSSWPRSWWKKTENSSMRPKFLQRRQLNTGRQSAPASMLPAGSIMLTEARPIMIA